MKGQRQWTGKHGITSEDQFLKNPRIQEIAYEEYTRKNIGYLKSKGAWSHIGRTIEGKDGTFKITSTSLVLAAHREGAGTTNRYLNHQQKHGWKTDVSKFPQGELGEKFLHIETRLRENAGLTRIWKE